MYYRQSNLAKVDAVIYDATPGKEALLYVWKDGDRYVRMAVRPNFKLKGDAYTNAVRSGHLVDARNLQGPAFTLLEGSL